MLTEGVPAHLKYPLDEWLKTEFGWHNSGGGGMNNEFMRTLAMVTKIPVNHTYEIGGISDQILGSLARDEDLYLDALDATLHLRRARARADTLRELLRLGSSAWTVNAAGSGLQRRVDETAAAAFETAVAPPDPVSAELAEAWAAAFGRTSNPSDAWDHAIKAVEELLIPIVLPAIAKPNLGGVAGELQSSSHKWKLVPTTSSTSLDDGRTIAAMLRMIWPNPDRHGGGVDRRPPVQEEAESVVHLAVAIVQMCRDGGLTKIP